MLGGSTNYQRWRDQSRVFHKLAVRVKDAGLRSFVEVRDFLVANSLVPESKWPFTKGYYSEQTPDPISPERLAACVIQTMRNPHG